MTTSAEHREISEGFLSASVAKLEYAEHAHLAMLDSVEGAFAMSQAMVFATLARGHAALAALPDMATETDIWEPVGQMDGRD